MALNKKEIRDIAFLARLSLKGSEINDVHEKLTKIINFIDQLQVVNTEEVDPMAHPLNQTQRLRIDKITDINQRDKIQNNAPEVSDGFYLVPKVIE
jgi:aspartyl-tRNA(Asn)/glutamyl-tRNA(Gln) amidotransferase subunit C